ncbi:hypothetical protein EAS64_33790 [Trebonia kvetii]|uniref:Uncharacterized protein n=1 Tax=Trebonia kvetii TaxID=2480626 RepID=A0A6P2BQG4_9ACTN|nr:hypothetical protein [Trebonia kvetii]TVZ01254.1 hypothetical protein EAS64_33790 [Trebonia kvetii]
MEIERIKGGLFAALTDVELGALSAMFQSARRKARMGHRSYWWSRKDAHAYSDMIAEFSLMDPLFVKRNIVHG